VANLAIWLVIAPIHVKTVANKSVSIVVKLVISSVIVLVLHLVMETQPLVSIVVKKVTSLVIVPMAIPVVVKHLEVNHLEKEEEEVVD